MKPAATMRLLAVRFLAVALPALTLPALALIGSAPPAAALEADVVVMQGLDKITARTRTFEVPIGSSRGFGSLEITARHCDKTPPEEPPEQKAFLEIVDVRPDREAMTAFTGWMFSSSPALNALEHPVYDVWVIGCRIDGEDTAQAG